jgi:hypothetical protein
VGVRFSPSANIGFQLPLLKPFSTFNLFLFEQNMLSEIYTYFAYFADIYKKKDFY